MQPSSPPTQHRSTRWPTVMLRLPDGSTVEAIAPLILSASRRTDIPAFHTDWFFRRLDEGYCVTVNPYNGHRQPVSLDRVRAVVFWTKNPAPLIPRLAELDRRGIGYYIQFTLNDYEAENLEPNLPPLENRIATFIRLSRLIGPSKVIWRFDPLLLTDRLDAETLARRVLRLGDRLARHTRRLVVSLLEPYPKVRQRLPHARPPSADEARHIAARIAEANRTWRLELAACASPIDLSDHGFHPLPCIDDRLLGHLFPHDTELMRFLGHDTPPLLDGHRPRLKDPGQRPLCHCVVSKDIGDFDTCGHLCRYCYANSHDRRVLRRLEHLDLDTPTLTPRKEDKP